MRVALHGLALAAACRPADPAAADLVAPAPVEAPRCRDVPTATLAWARAPGCGAALGGDPIPRLRSLELDAPTEGTPVSLPPACGRGCLFELFSTRFGWLVLATAPGPEAEGPAIAALGIPAGDAYRFVELWLDAAVTNEMTPTGPAFGLAPFDCAGRLAFLPRARLDGAEHESPSPALVAAAGSYTWTGEEPTVTPVDPEGCTPLALPLP